MPLRFAVLVACLAIAMPGVAASQLSAEPTGTVAAGTVAAGTVAAGTPAPAAAVLAPDPNPAESTTDADDWIQPEDVVDRADSLTRRLDTRRVGASTLAAIDKIDAELSRLDDELERAFEQAKVAASGDPSLMAIQDARRELKGSSVSFPAWRERLETEAKRVASVLAEMADAERRWLRTRSQPETIEAGDAVVNRVNESLAMLDDAGKQLGAWRVRVLALNDRLLDHSTGVADSLERLEAATISEGSNLLVPDRAPLWKRDLAAQFAKDLPEVSKRYLDFQRITAEYVVLDERPFLLQIMVWIALMFALRNFSHGSHGRLDEPSISSEAARVLTHPYAIASLFTLMASPHLHPTAPQRVMQLFGLLAMFPVARILSIASDRINPSIFVGLFLLMVIDRVAIALAALPAVSLVLFFAELAIALPLILRYRRGLVESGGNSALIRTLTIASGAVGLAVVTQIGGWSSLSVLIGRGVLVSGVTGLYVYAATVSLTAIVAHALATPALRSSRFVDRNQPLLQRWSMIALRLAGIVFWFNLLVSAMGIRDLVVEGFEALLAAGVTVGALSLSVGGVLAFVSTIAVSMFFGRFVHEVLEDEIFPRTNLPRGIPHALLTLTNYTIYSLGFLLALAAAGVQLGQLSIMLGGLGVGIGLGLQDVVKNFAAGITLLLERRVHVGDAVQIADKNVFGRILAIGMRASVIRNWNGTEVVIPNDDLVSGTVTNWTLSDVTHRLEVSVGVGYGSDPETVIGLLLGVAHADGRLLTTPPASAFFTGFGDSSLDFVLRAWSGEEYETAAARTSELGVAVHRALREAGIELPFPQRSLHLATVSEQAGAALRTAATAD